MAGTLSDWCQQPASNQPWYVQTVMAPATMLCPFVGGSNFGSDVTTYAGGAVLGNYPAPPAPPAPAVTLSTDPTAADQPGAQYAGQDASGTAVYAVPETAQENMTRYKALVDQFMNDVGTKNPPTDFWSKYGTVLAIAGAVVGALVLYKGTGGRR
jgi:hypothetical protein